MEGWPFSFDRSLSPPVVVAALVLFTLGITVYLNTGEMHKYKERRTALYRQFVLTDQNANGFVDWEESAAAYRREFATLDFDRDGIVSHDEFVGLRESWAKYHASGRWKVIQAEREAAFAMVDRNGDGRLTAAEYVDYHLAVAFAAMDTDGDRKVTRSKFMAAMGPK